MCTAGAIEKTSRAAHSTTSSASRVAWSCNLWPTGELMRAALRNEVDVVLAEALGRFSRDQEDTAGLFKRLTFAGVSIVTLAESGLSAHRPQGNDERDVPEGAGRQDSASAARSHRAERQSGRDVNCCPTNEKVARNGRPSHAGTVGCGGLQSAVSAPVLGGSVSVKRCRLTEVPDVRRCPLG